MSNPRTERVEYPEFAGTKEGQQLFDVWNDFYNDSIGPVFPYSVQLPIGGMPTEDGEAIFGHHLNAMEKREREWKFAWRLYSVVRNRLESDIPVAEDGETVIALPRSDFNEKQNLIAIDGTVNRGLSAFADRSSYDLPEHFEVSRDLPRYTRKLEDGTVELVQEQNVSLAVRKADIAMSGIVVAVRRLYGPAHRQFAGDLRAVEMTLAPQSVLTGEHTEHPTLISTFGSGSKLDLSDDAIVERVNGQRPRTTDFGIVL